MLESKRKAQTVTITEEIGDDRAITVHPDDVAESIRPWFPGAPSHVLSVIDDLQGAINQGTPTDGFESFLGIRLS